MLLLWRNNCWTYSAVSAVLCRRWPVSAAAWSHLEESSYVNTQPHRDRTSSGSDSCDCSCSSWPIRSDVSVRSYPHCCRYNAHIHPSTPGRDQTAWFPGGKIHKWMTDRTNERMNEGNTLLFTCTKGHSSRVQATVCVLMSQ